MKKKTILAIFVTSLFILSIIFFILFSMNKSKSKPIALLPLTYEEDGTEEVTVQDLPRLKGIEVSLVDKRQQLNWELTVEKLIEEDEVFLLSSVNGEYFASNGQKYLVEAATGEMGKDFSWLRLTSEVNFSGEEIWLQAAELSWNSGCGEEITGKKLVVTGQDLRIQADEFCFTPEKGGLVVPGKSKWSFRYVK